MASNHSKTASIEISCTLAQKQSIHAQAQAVGAKSVSQYLLTIALDGNTQEYGSLRRTAEGSLVNAQTYKLLFDLVQTLKAHPQPDTPLLQQTLDLVEITRREIVLHRLTAPLEDA